MEMIDYRPAGDKFTNIELYAAAQKFLAKAPDDADVRALSAVRR